MTTIQESYVDQARLLLDQGKVSEAWTALADGGDVYAESAADITNTNGSVAKFN